ncbi:MAG TPA: 1-acyl-sn-glycerol-3-phosphate acyltransferase [Myxococcota bacterium]|nr:1-acyl-sn-glycerol-3-phosphate acyltransferase [Myxococcota bacterium]
MSEQAVEPPEGRGARAATTDRAAAGSGLSPAARLREPQAVDALSSMTPRFNLPLQWFARRYFCHFDLDDATVEQLRDLENRGSIVYVMRYASRLDYFLFNALFLREGLGLSKLANGIRFYYYRPAWQAIRLAWRRRGEWLREPGPEFAHARLRALIERGENAFVFLRTGRLRSRLRSRRRAVEHGRGELELLEEVVRTVLSSGETVHVVPLALFWRKGPRSQQRFLNLSYGSSTRPSDFAKVASFLVTYRGLHIRVGDPIDLGAFAAECAADSPQRIARRLRRNVLTFLYREEKVVEGPALRPRHRVQEVVIGAPAVRAAISRRADERHGSLERAQAEAAKMFREIAANMNSTILAALNLIISAILRRMFVSIELIGIGKIADYAKRHPVVLVPSHRSYFDFIILSTAFYANHLVPPHIAARENMAFGPFGYLWRRGGAFFLRRSFADPLYTAVFRSYVTYLIRQGFTQEFFIEGGRSRTGKSLAPRLGMLAWNVDAFLQTARRDLFFVPIAITYERLVEEGAIVGEREGEEKEQESVIGLVRARKFLRRRFGSVWVNFGEPISLASALGARREAFAGDSPEAAQGKREFVESLGNRIVERINWAVVPNATSVAACALLGGRSRGLYRDALAARMRTIVELLRLQDARLTPTLASGDGGFRDAIASLLASELIRSTRDERGEVLYFEEERRTALDLYRNSIVHYLAVPSFLARRLLSDVSLEELREDLAGWLDLFYGEFFTPRGEMLAAHFDAFVDHFERMGWIERRERVLRPTGAGSEWLEFLSEQTQGFIDVYYATAEAVAALRDPLGPKQLLDAARDQLRRAELLGEVARGSSAASETTFANALAQLERADIIARERSASGREPSFVRGAAFEQIDALRERLAFALAAR